MSARRCAMTVALVAALAAQGEFAFGDAADDALGKIGVRKGICVVLGLPRGDGAAFVTALAKEDGPLVYVQLSDAGEVSRLQRSVEATGLLGRRVFVSKGAPERVHLGDNLADGVLVYSGGNVRDAELLRVLRPGGKALVGARTIVKPAPAGTDPWSHPYHDPSNNPQSTDRVARAPYMTQYLARPVFGCTPTVTVAAGGRVFRAYGHIAFTTYQNEVLETLYATSACNGTLLWKRKLTPGFQIHRNTMIATPEALYLADDTSCKLIDPETGEVIGEIVPPVDLAGGTVWKWMGLEGGRLYALMGGEEVKAPRRPGRSPGFGGWPWGMWPGYDYKDRERAWGFGRAFLAMDAKTGKVLWTHRETELVDSRAVCMSGGRIYFHSPGKALGCLNAGDGKVLWRTDDTELLQAIGPHDRAQNPRTGFTTSVYMKCNDRYLLFAGPQQSRLVAVSTTDGKLLWQTKDGNRQLVLREDALYAAGFPGVKIDYATGEVLAQFRGRHNCTRATGSIDSIFYRGPNGTTRIIPATNAEEHIAPMRPPCQDGVVIADGLLHWGPWICGCRNSLWGHICLGPGGGFDFARKADERRQLEVVADDVTKVEPLEAAAGDWPAFRRDSRCNSTTATVLPGAPRQLWTWKPDRTTTATAPVTAGGRVFIADTDGVVRALNAGDGKPVWKAYTEGAVYYPPAIWNGRAYVGSNDGHVYAFEAATGRLLWRFRVAPVERRIPVFGSLIATWPVAGGVAVEDGVVYAAAGIAHFDGTHVCALDAVTGKMKWHNNDSGVLHAGLRNGIGLMGNVRLAEGRLEFPGGNAYPTASFDATTGTCVTRPGDARGHTRDLFHPRDAWDLQTSLVTDVTLRAPSGTVAIAQPKAEGRRQPPRKLSFTPTAASEEAGFEKWEMTAPASCRGLVCFADALMIVTTRGEQSTLAARRLKDGEVLWSRDVPAQVVVWGVAVDAAGRIFVSCEDGRVLCFAPGRD
ncbi:MAG TPA: PQQ-binding-like beta-propeller repeat protein [Planctomycetota bacterium]|nr:PQQ-binding-like beta-propeller repeat protein [Planctomycetota bacterium]